MDFYNFLRWNLAWMASIALIWPINIGIAALAFKVKQGARPLGMGTNELWTRSTFASLFLALMTAAFVLVDFFLARGMPPGLVHLVIYVCYVVAACWLFFVMFGQDDPTEGVSLFVLYMYLPMTVLYLLNKLTGLWNPLLNYLGGWLKAP